MRCFALTVTFALLAIAGCVSSTDNPALVEQVRQVETDFARTMADRDLAAFANLLSEEAVFLSGATSLRGKTRVVEAWQRYFDGAVAPFSWHPQTVEVLESGKLALSTGPVRRADGTQVAVFTSIWRQEAPGVWRIVFDRGTEFCGDQ